MHKVTVTFSKFVIYVFVNIVFDFASLLEIYINEENEKSNFMVCLLCCALDQFWEFSLRDTVLFVAREIKWVQLGAFSEHWPLMSAIALVTAIGDKRTEWNALWWGIMKMVSVVNDEKCLQIFFSYSLASIWNGNLLHPARDALCCAHLSAEKRR